MVLQSRFKSNPTFIIIAQVDSGSSESVVTLTHIAREDGSTCRNRPRKVDLQLPTLETASWWRGDGHDTLGEEELSVRVGGAIVGWRGI